MLNGYNTTMIWSHLVVITMLDLWDLGILLSPPGSERTKIYECQLPGSNLLQENSNQVAC